MNNKGDMNDITGALVGLLIAVITLYVVMVVWQPVTNDLLFPLLNNTEAFPHGPTAIVLLNVVILVAVAAIFIAFFNHARGERKPPTYYG